MPMYKVPLVWEMWGRLTVEASSEEEAVRIALAPETPLPEGSYIDESAALDTDGEVIEC